MTDLSLYGEEQGLKDGVGGDFDVNNPGIAGLARAYSRL